MNSSMVVKIATVATVTVGDMGVAVESSGILLLNEIGGESQGKQ